MTYIKLNDDMSLSVTQADTIHRGDNMSTAITYIMPLNAGDIDLKTATVFLAYIRSDGNPDVVILDRSYEMYDKDHYMYTLPVNCKMSKYAGAVCMWLNIYAGDCCNPTVRKSGECTIHIVDSKNIDDYLCDHHLTAIYQLKKMLENNNVGSGGNIPDIPDTPDTPDTPIAAGNVLYFGSGAGSVPEVTSDVVLALTGTKSSFAEGSSFEVNVSYGHQYVMFAYPSSMRDVSNITYVQANDPSMVANFDKHTIDIAAADGKVVNYKVYTYSMAIPAITAMTFKVTI